MCRTIGEVRTDLTSLRSGFLSMEQIGINSQHDIETGAEMVKYFAGIKY